MVNKSTEAAVENIPAAKKAVAKKSDSCAVGFYCYIGPSIPGLIQAGKIFRGTRDDALAAAAGAIKAQPLVKTLIVSGDTLPVDRLKVKTPGNALYVNYKRIAGKK